MDRNRMIGSIVFLATTVLFAACGKDHVTGPGAYTLTGQVRLVGTLRVVTGESTGVQLVENADSVRVYLYRDATLEDSARTTAGVYRFRGLRGGPYSVVATLWGDIGDTVSIASVSANLSADTLVLSSSPTMIGYPNPCQGSAVVLFQLPTDSFGELIVRRPSGVTVRSLLQQDLVAGYHEVNWDARDDSGTLVPPGPYWFLFKTGSDYRCRLVVKE